METQNPSSGRLTTSVKPERYRITLTVNPEAGQFSGHVLIDVDLQEAARSITLHALELAIDRAEIETAGKTVAATVTENKEAETITLAPPDKIPGGKTILTITFSGRLNRQLRGFYESRATHEGKMEHYAFTQCEPTDARRIFPCFDEPALKARFRLTAYVPGHLTALSNMPIVKETAGSPNKCVEFDETPVMPTYLFALAVARLDVRTVTVDGCRLSVWAMPEQLRYTDFALEVGAAALSRLNAYFNLRYPLAKLDLVALPDFAMGAMENWGAIFFRDSCLLVDDALASTATKRMVANVITHEIVHQWFGNLVTMAWWDDLWLNESFATWLAVKIVDQWKPEWRSWVEFRQEKQVPFSVDALDTTRPVTARVASAAQIEEIFDALTYEKGAAVLRMIEQFLGEAPFRAGIGRYIADHQYANATAGALWRALEEASGQPVRAIAQDWFTQPGFPLISLEPLEPHNEPTRAVRIRQQRFHALERPTESRNGASWMVPLTLKYGDDQGVHLHRQLLDRTEAVIGLPGEGTLRWVMANGGEAGFYRSHYAPGLRSVLTAAVTTQGEPVERIGLLDDLWAMSQAGRLPIDGYLDCLDRFKGDRTRVVVQAAAAALELLSGQLAVFEDRLLMAAYVADWFTPLWAHYGWDPRADEPLDDDESRLARAATLWALGAIARDRRLLEETADRFDRYLSDPSSLDPTLATAVTRLHATDGDGARFERYVALLERAETPEVRDRYLLALADFPDAGLARRYLQLGLTDAIRAQDGWKPLRYLLGRFAHPDVQAEAWRFLRARWPALRDKSGSVGATRMIQGLRHLWRPQWREEIERFFDHPENRVASAERPLAQTLEFIDIGIAFKSRQQPALSAWLRRAG